MTPEPNVPPGRVSVPTSAPDHGHDGASARTTNGEPSRADEEALWREHRGAGPRLVLCHGFTQNGRCWGPFADDLATDHEVVLVDAPGHGRSGHDGVDLWQAGRLVGEVGGAAAYLGYSMGGRTALHLALERPDLVERLVLIGATAGIVDPDERRRRRHADEALADHLDRIGVVAFVDEWLSGPLFAGLGPDVAFAAERGANRGPGLSASLRSVGTGTQQPLWDRLEELRCPVLLLAGASDDKFSQIGRSMARTIGSQATFATVPGGHAVHLESPRATAEAVRRWLNTHPS